MYSTTPFFSRGPVTAFWVGPVSATSVSSNKGTNRPSRASTGPRPCVPGLEPCGLEAPSLAMSWSAWTGLRGPIRRAERHSPRTPTRLEMFGIMVGPGVPREPCGTGGSGWGPEPLRRIPGRTLSPADGSDGPQALLVSPGLVGQEARRAGSPGPPGKDPRLPGKGEAPCIGATIGATVACPKG